MKNILKKIGVISGVTFVVAVSFFAGLYVDATRLGIGSTTVDTNFTDAGHRDVDMNAFWKAWDIINSKYTSTATTTSNKDKVNGAIRGLADSLGDPYTTFFDAEENKNFQTDLSGTLEGIGAVLNVKDGLLTVVSVIKNSPAEKAKLEAGDRIIKIDDTDSTNIDIDRAVTLIRGKKGTSVKLIVVRGENKTQISFTIQRDTITTPIIETKKYSDDGVFAINIGSFTSNSPELFRAALREFVDTGYSKLIVDLRNNTGGYLEAAVDMTSWFVPTGKTVVTEDFGNNREPVIYRSKGYNLFNSNMKVVILVNENTASASEIFSGALRDYDRAVLVGTKTYGKGSVQELVPVTEDTMLKVTIARWLTPKGTSLAHDGLNPDYEVIPTEDDYKNKKDVQFDKALEIVNKINK